VRNKVDYSIWADYSFMPRHIARQNYDELISMTLEMHRLRLLTDEEKDENIKLWVDFYQDNENQIAANNRAARDNY